MKTINKRLSTNQVMSLLKSLSPKPSPQLRERILTRVHASAQLNTGRDTRSQWDWLRIGLLTLTFLVSALWWYLVVALVMWR